MPLFDITLKLPDSVSGVTVDAQTPAAAFKRVRRHLLKSGVAFHVKERWDEDSVIWDPNKAAQVTFRWHPTPAQPS